MYCKEVIFSCVRWNPICYTPFYHPPGLHVQLSRREKSQLGGKAVLPKILQEHANYFNKVALSLNMLIFFYLYQYNHFKTAT